MVGRAQPIKTRTGRFLLIALFFLMVAGGQTAHARTIAVHSIADDGPGSLRQALVLASNGDTINIVVNGTIILTSGELLVNKSLKIRGPGPHGIVSGNGTSRVFHVTPNTIVTISGLTIANGSVSTAFGPFLSSAGGGIFSDHADLTVSNCIISGNSARYGGGIFSNSLGGGSAALTISRTTLVDNSASFVGGGVFSGGGFSNTVDSGDASLRINNSSLTNNSARIGGGIFNDGFYGTATLTVHNSTIRAFPSNFSQPRFPGAAIYNNGDSGVADATVTNSTVTSDPSEFGFENTSGIYNDGDASVRQGIATLTITDSSVSSNSSFGFGGIENVGNTNLTINNSTCTDNAGPCLMNRGLATVNNSTFSRNLVGIRNEGAILTVNNSTVSENSGGFHGGISNHFATATLNNSNVRGNSDHGIFNECATLTLNNSTVSANTADFNGAGIQNYCAASGVNSTVTLMAGTVNNNAHVGIFNYGAQGSSAILTLINSTVSNNSGIGIYTSGVDEGGSGLLILKNSTLSGNSTCPGCGAGGIQNISLFGGIATVEISNTIFKAGSDGINIGSLDGTVISHGYNLSSDGAGGDGGSDPGGLLNGPGDIRNTNPLLGPLRNNGGPTKTHALLLGSPAIDAGDPIFNPFVFSPPLLFDQRGALFRRVVNGRIDIGALESKYH